MPKKRIIAFGLHETEIAAARQALHGGEVTESFVLGEAEEADIAALRARGLVIQELPEAEPAPLPGSTRRATFRPGARPLRVRGPARRPTSFYRLALRGPLLEPWRAAIEQAGGSILEALSPTAIRIRIDPAKLPALEAQGFLAAPPEPLDTAAATLPTFAATTLAPASGVTPVLPYDVLLTGPDARAPLLAWLQERGVPVAGAQGRKVRLYALPESPLLDELVGLSEWVERVEDYVAPKLLNDVARTLLGVAEGAPGAAFPYEGADQIVAVADTGLDDSHPDFAGRIVQCVGLGRPGDWSDPNGHGTHVAGSVLGDGKASGGTLKGTAPKAQLFFQSLLDRDDGLGGLPFELGGLFEQAYAAGARIHNNSWGAATESNYRITSSEVDEFVRRRPDMLVVVAAGNEGSAFQPRNAKQGYVDWLSIGSPATSKNALTVGASRSSRAVGAYAPHTYGELWGDQFPAEPIAKAPVSGDPQCMGAFSSRGPCDEYRIKPDLVAPGTDILSARSSRAPLRNFWGADPSQPRYAYMGGTSMATPLVSGCAALVREYYTKTRSHQPSAALLKATLINGTRRLTGDDSVADYPELPNYHQGFGAVYLPTTLPAPVAPSFTLEFFDNWNAPDTHLTAIGRRIRLRFELAAGSPLRLCMAYTDVPGRGVQNNLNLFLEQPGTPQKLFGNAQVPRGFNSPDPNNNVEVIRLEDAPAGTYLAAVVASNLLHPPQDVALVVTGRLLTPLTRI
jgi:subtilisin family serine protease